MKKARPDSPADRARTKQPRWYQTLRFRFAVLLALALLAFDWVSEPLYDRMLQLLSWLGFAPLSYVANDAALSILAAVVIASLSALALSRWVTGRLAHLVQSASQPPASGELPGPFDDSGSDEISVLAATMNSLRERVAERLDGLALKETQRREWIAQVSHDLRTPLTAQLACLDRADLILQKPDSPLLRKELRELLVVAKMDADRVHTLADDLLEIARLDAGDALRLETVPPGELVRQTVRGLEPLAAQKGIHIEISVTSRLPMLNADGRRLMRALENLLRNAIQHARSRVEVSATLSSTCVRFEVRDDGRGLPKQPDFLDYLRRLNGEIRLTELARRRSRGDSAGLGLVVAQRVAAAHHGIVGAYNRSMGGAAFWLDVPMPADGSAD